MNTQRGRIPLHVACLLIVGVAQARAQQTPDLFRETSLGGSFILKPDATVVRQRNITIDLARLRGSPNDAFRLPLFRGASLVVLKDRQEMPRPNTFLWFGHVADQPGTTVILSNVGDAVSANFFGKVGTAITSYDIRYLGNGVHVLRQINMAAFQAEAPPQQVQPPPEPEGADLCTGDPPTDIDALIVYTDDVVANSASASAVESEIYLAVGDANQAYVDSDIGIRLRVVHVQEVNYPETRQGEMDRNRLQDPSLGYLQGVRDLRNAYSADLVALLVDRLDFCGYSFVTDDLTPAFESFAYAVVKRSCASDNRSLAHEFGHLMGAHHNRFSEESPDPTKYNYGYLNRTPPNGGKAYYTLMATYRQCDEPPKVDCDRLFVFSNPDPAKKSPPAYGSGPLGVANSEDNHQRLLDTRSIVANFRCVSPTVNNVWMRDTADDTGREPDPKTAGEDMWLSPAIWVRNTQDAAGAHSHDHENPIAGKPNWVYVEMQNGGGKIHGDLELYFANASVSLTWPAGWTLIPATLANPATPVDFSPMSSRVVEVPWTPPLDGHFCLLARWVSQADPMEVAETQDIESNVRNNNNIVWRNVNVVDLTGAQSAMATFEVRPPDGGGAFSLVVRGLKAHGGEHAAPPFRLSFELDGVLLEAWRRGGARSRNARLDGARFVLGEPDEATLSNLRLENGAAGRVRLVFERSGVAPQGDVVIDVLQRLEDAGPSAHPIGGVSYVVRTDGRRRSNP